MQAYVTRARTKSVKTPGNQLALFRSTRHGCLDVRCGGEAQGLRRIEWWGDLDNEFSVMNERNVNVLRKRNRFNGIVHDEINCGVFNFAST